MLAVLAWAATMQVSAAASALTPQLSSFLSTYVANSALAAATYASEPVGGGTYAVVAMNASSTIVVNTTSSAYSFVFNKTLAAKALSPYITAKYYPNSIALQSLNSTMAKFRNTSQSSLNDCRTETGSALYQCTASTPYVSCLQYTCQSVPVCTKVLSNFGSGSTFGYGLFNFSVQYDDLNTSYGKFFSTLASMSKSNAGASISQLSTISANISALTSFMLHNPVFPPPTNISTSQLSTICTQYTSGTGPWYCTAVGFCNPVTFNRTLISSVQSQLSALSALPLSNSSISALAASSVTLANDYYLPVFNRTNLAAFTAFINSATPRYTALVANMTFIVSGYQNSSLSVQLNALKAAYAGIQAAGAQQNVTKANATLAVEMANSIALYNRIAPAYLAAYVMAGNTTALLLSKQLNYKVVQPNVAALALQQAKINTALSGQVNATALAALSAQMKNISAQASAVSTPMSAGAAVKSLYGGMLASMLYSPTATMDASLASAPSYSAVITLVIGLIVLVVVYFGTYFRLSRNRKLNLTPRVRRAWLMLFAVIFLIVIVLSAVTYSVAQGANSFLPADGFTNLVAGSQNVYVLVNKSIASNASVQQCIKSIKSISGFTNKSFYTVNFTAGYSCTLNSTTTGQLCINKLLYSGAPVVVMGPGSNGSITYGGLYGYTLFAYGQAAYGPSCPVAAILRVG